MAETNIKDILKKLTLEEKSALVAGATAWTTLGIERLGIPSIMMTDGPHGLRKPSDNMAGNPATCFPTASALSATWNRQLIHQVGAAIGSEAQSQDVQVVLGPGINLKRSPLGGRNFEYYSEDPVLSADLGIAFIEGLRSVGVGAVVKHYAANNQEFERMTSSSEIDDRALHELYLRTFRRVVRHAQPWAVMASYNKINGEYVSRSRYLLTDTLRDEWGYRGVVVSDWGAAAEKRVETLKAGLDLEMPGGGSGNEKRIQKAVEEGNLNESVLDGILERLIPAIKSVATQRKTTSSVDIDRHHQLAREVAAEAIVLLKNNDVLPIKASQVKKIALIGRFAKTPRFQGAGSSQVTPTKVDNLYDSLTAVFGEKSIIYSSGYQNSGKATQNQIKEAVLAAKKADLVIVAAGLPATYETEGLDRKTIDLPDGHNKLITELSKQKAPVVVLLTNGSAVSMPWLDEVDGVLEGWLGGQAGASAMVDILTGAVNPSGKLAETFPVRLEDTPTYPYFPGAHGKAIYGEGVFIGYRYFEMKGFKPLFPFGFGLSYTTFSYGDVTLSRSLINNDETFTASITIKNEGKVAGKTVAQLYIGYKNNDMPRPIKELKNFEKISLEPGEAKTVTFHISPEDLEYYDEQHRIWRVGEGEYDVWISSMAFNEPPMASFRVKKGKPIYPVITRQSLMKDLANHPKGKTIYKMIAKQAGESFLGAEKKKPSKEEIELSLAIINDIPLSRLPALSEGLLDDSFVDAVVLYCKHAKGFRLFDTMPLLKVGIVAAWKQILHQK